MNVSVYVASTRQLDRVKNTKQAESGKKMPQLRQRNQHEDWYAKVANDFIHNKILRVVIMPISLSPRRQPIMNYGEQKNAAQTAASDCDLAERQRPKAPMPA